jgi:hypothetical protein
MKELSNVEELFNQYVDNISFNKKGEIPFFFIQPHFYHLQSRES